MATADPAHKLIGAFIDETGAAKAEDEVGRITFYSEAEPWMLLSEGGLIDKKHKDVEIIRRLEREALSLLRADKPFTDPEPQPPAKDALPAVKREYEQAHADWDERRLSHEKDLKEQASLLSEDSNMPAVYVVRKTDRPYFVDREYIRIETPGDPGNIVERAVRADDIHKWRNRYAAWKENKQSTIGTPLELIGVSKAQRKTLAYYNVETVEDLAKVHDAALATMGPFQTLRQKARDHIAATKASAPVEEARREAAAAKEEVEKLRKQMAEMMEQFTAPKAQPAARK